MSDPLSEFDQDTALVPRAGGFRGEVTSRWNIAGRPNAGYLLALAARALGASVAFPDPLTVTGHFLRPPEPGPVDIDVELLRSGGHAAAMARLAQGEREFLRALGTLSDLVAAQGPTLVGAALPVLPPPEACIPVRRAPLPAWPTPPEFFDRLDLRLVEVEAAGEAVGRVEGWVRFADGRPPYPASLPLFADAFPPAVHAVAPTAWVPTVELTVHIRARPVPGWLAASFRTRFLIEGYLEEDGELWDTAGHLVALSRQLAIARGPISGAGAGV